MMTTISLDENGYPVDENVAAEPTTSTKIARKSTANNSAKWIKGWLLKRSVWKRKWNKRYFLVDKEERTMLYFLEKPILATSKNIEDRRVMPLLRDAAKGAMKLDAGTAVVVKKLYGRQHTFTVMNKDRKQEELLAAANDEERAAWVDGIQALLNTTFDDVGGETVEEAAEDGAKRTLQLGRDDAAAAAGDAASQGDDADDDSDDDDDDEYGSDVGDADDVPEEGQDKENRGKKGRKGERRLSTAKLPITSYKYSYVKLLKKHKGLSLNPALAPEACDRVVQQVSRDYERRLKKTPPESIAGALLLHHYASFLADVRKNVKAAASFRRQVLGTVQGCDVIHRWHCEVLERREHAPLAHAAVSAKAFHHLTDNQRSRLMLAV